MTLMKAAAFATLELFQPLRDCGLNPGELGIGLVDSGLVGIDPAEVKPLPDKPLPDKSLN